MTNFKTLENCYSRGALVSFMRDKPVYRIDKPIRPARSRSIGYKSVPGVICVIGRIKKGGINPKIPARGRSPTNIYKRYSRNVSKFDILKNKVSRMFKNMKVMGGYYLTQNGQYTWYQFILKDQSLCTI